MTDQLRDADRGERRSGQEVAFEWRWRQLIDRAGGQSLVARRLNWATSTVSRDYKGDTLPTDQRLAQLCDFLKLSDPDRLDLERLLSEARAARRARPRGKGAEAAPAAGQHAAPGRTWPRSPVWAVAAVAVVAVVAVTVIVALRPAGSGPSPVAAIQPGPKPTGGPYPGLKLQAIPIPLTSLRAPLNGVFGQNHAVTGYEFRNSKNTGLCLGAMTTGGTAGDNRDPVRVWNCSRAPNEIWIPEQWEINGSRFTWLVNYEYQSKCLNADNIGGLGKNHKVQLWDCYNSPNEEWDFGDWYKGLKSGAHSYPIFVDSANFCLDANKYALRNGAVVHIWDQYPNASQFWS